MTATPKTPEEEAKPEVKIAREIIENFSARASALEIGLEDVIAAAIRSAVSAERERCAGLVPTTWLDPLLTGPDAALPQDRYEYRGPDVEKLLNGLAARIRAEPESAKGEKT